MNRSRWMAGSYQLLLILLTLFVPLLIYFGTRGAESGYGTVGAILAFVILLAYLIIPNRRQGR